MLEARTAHQLSSRILPSFVDGWIANIYWSRHWSGTQNKMYLLGGLFLTHVCGHGSVPSRVRVGILSEV